MNKSVYITHSNLNLPSGSTKSLVLESLYSNKSAIQQHEHPLMQGYFASKFSPEQLPELIPGYSLVETLLINIISETITTASVSLTQPEVVLILSTTKGDINHLYSSTPEKAKLSYLSGRLQQYFKAYNKPLVVSNACISGMQALEVSKILLQTNTYKKVVIAAIDMVSDFVLSGFFSFQALSGGPCLPFDKSRSGLCLGEGCAVAIVESEKTAEAVEIVSIASSNDANHISGPSRTGDGLSLAIRAALKTSGIPKEDLALINAHGTATLYNDEMESLAFQTMELTQTPMNSLKGYLGHTLGAAGLIETIITAEALKHNKVLASKGYTEQGTSVEVNLSNQHRSTDKKFALKTGSAFGGANSAIILSVV